MLSLWRLHIKLRVSSVSQLFLAETVGKSGTPSLVELSPPEGVSSDLFAAYAVYDGGAPVRIAVINWQTFNSTMGEAGVRATSLGMDISGLVHKKKATLKRLTAPGSDEKNADYVTWAGQAWTNGTAEGKEAIEAVKNGKIKLRGSEAVLVFVE